MSGGYLSYPYEPYRRGSNGRALVADMAIRESDAAMATYPDRDGRRRTTGPSEPERYCGLFGNLDATSASQARGAGRLSLIRRLTARRLSCETMLGRCVTQEAMRACLTQIVSLTVLIGDLMGEAHAAIDNAGLRLRDVRQGCRQMVAANDRLRLANAGLLDDESGVA